MAKLKISKKAFLGLDQEKLVLYVQDLLLRCEAQPEFAAFQPQLDTVKAAFANFDAKLLDAVPGGRDRTALKKHARAVLLDKLVHFVEHVDVARLPEDVLIRAGFATAPTPQRLAGVQLQMPEIRLARPVGDGTVELKFGHPKPKQVRSYLFEWSPDQGVTWNSGAYGNRSPVRLSGLPPLQKVVVRMCCLGSHGRSSAWTAPLEVSVW
jgi:hypothetical protein